MFESNYNYVPNPYPPAPGPGPGPAPYYPYPPHPHPQPGPGIPPVFVDQTLTIPGAAADAAVTGKLIGSKLNIDALSGNIRLVDGKVELAGLPDAEVGQVPVKDKDGGISWMSPASVSDIEDLQTQVNSINSSITNINADIDQLYADDARQDTKIAALEELINNTASQLDSQIEAINNELATKLSQETFQDFIENDFNDLLDQVSALQEGVDNLESCCQDVMGILGNAQYYEQPIYQTLQDFETHSQSINRDFDGGDLDDLDPEMVPVPNVVGKAASVANLILGRVGLFTDASLSGASYDDKIVTSQSPAANESVSRGSLVQLELGGQG